MNRRELLATGIGGALVHTLSGPQDRGEAPSVRDLFPRLERDTFLDAAGGTPLGRFAEVGLRRFEEFWRHGRGGGRWEAVSDALDGTRAAFATLVGAKPNEIAFVHCTKAGEQVVLDGLPALRSGGNVVTNDMHFSGSLHNLVGLRRSGLDVRIVRAEDWEVGLEAMEAAIDDETALVCVTLVSNVNGRIEPLPQLAEIAHAHGALVYADIIQAAGVVPVDVRALGVDFAACSGYKWLFGPHGVGFLFVREELQGSELTDRLFPGHARPNYAPWVGASDPDHGDYLYSAPADARRYQPGHMSYLGYSALHEGLAFVESFGVDAIRDHGVRLVARLLARLDADRYPCISPHADRSPIVTFLAADPAPVPPALTAARITVSIAGARIRVSPAIYNDEGDVDRLADVLNAL